MYTASIRLSLPMWHERHVGHFVVRIEQQGRRIALDQRAESCLNRWASLIRLLVAAHEPNNNAVMKQRGGNDAVDLGQVPL